MNTISERERNLQVREYIQKLFCSENEPLSFARTHSKELQLKPIAVSPAVGKMLYMFCLLQNPRRLLEIGTLGGYSALWLAKGMQPGSTLITLENQEKNATAARDHFERAGCQIEIRLGEAETILKKMRDEPPFDLIFIDADKQNYPLYLDLCLELSRPGTLILTDNLIPKRGAMENPDPRDLEALAVYAFNQRLATHPKLESMLFPTIGSNGALDALGVSLVKFSSN